MIRLCRVMIGVALLCAFALFAPVSLAAPPKAAKACDCDCCKPTCKCEPGKRDPQCKCYPCPAEKAKQQKVGGEDCCADVKFTDIGFFKNDDGSEEIAFVRTKDGLEIGGDEFKGKDLFLVSDLGFDSKPVSVKELHDWASQTVGTSFIRAGGEVYFFGEKKVAKSQPVAAPQAAPTAAPAYPAFPAFPSCPNCSGGNCPNQPSWRR